MSRRTRRWWYRAGLAIGVVLLVAAAARLWWWRPGDVDPVGAVFAFAGVAVAALSWWQTQRLADTDVPAAVRLLAQRVTAEEKAQRAQLLGRKGRDAVIDVGFAFDPAGSAVSAPEGGSLTRVAGYFRELRPPRRLVIAGAAGSGKTVLAIELILELLADLRPGDPVPVRISAASLDPDVPVRDMLARHLTAAYNLRPVTARTLVEAEKILPVIDGLDEMDETDEPGYGSRAARALRALEDYEHGLDRCSLVVTCRDEQYDALVADRAAPHGMARVDVAEVSGDKAWRFVQAVTDQRDPDRWQPVLDALTTDGHVLAGALRTPWRLTLAVSVYEERDPRTGRYVRSPAALTEFSDERSVREHLLSLFIPARLAAADPAGKGPDAERTHAWLAVLADHLRGRGSRAPGTDLVLHRLWPLAGDRPRAVAAVIALVAGLPGVAVVVAALALAISQVEIVDGKISGRLVGAFMLLWLPVLLALGLLAEPVRAWREVPRADPSRGVRGRKGALVMAGLLGAGTCLAGTAVILEIGIDLPLWTPPLVGLLVGVGAVTGESGVRQGSDPRAIIGHEAGSTLVAALTSGPGFGFLLGIWLSALLEGVSVGTALIGGTVFGMSVAASWSPQLSRYYLGLLLSTRGRLPWRLGRFLHRCYGAGLLRVSGIAYQFRHRELQDYLAGHPVPSGAREQDREPA